VPKWRSFSYVGSDLRRLRKRELLYKANLVSRYAIAAEKAVI
jgi:hypothetical protein